MSGKMALQKIVREIMERIIAVIASKSDKLKQTA